MLKTPAEKPPTADVIALKALGFLASDDERFSRFMADTGLTPEMIRSGAGEPGFLAAVLDQVTADQTLLFLFAESCGISPSQIDQARLALSGAGHDF